MECNNPVLEIYYFGPLILALLALLFHLFCDPEIFIAIKLCDDNFTQDSHAFVSVYMHTCVTFCVSTFSVHIYGTKK